MCNRACSSGTGRRAETAHPVKAAERCDCKTQATELEIRPDAELEIHVLEKKWHVTLNDIKWSRPKFEISSEGRASLLIQFPL